MIYVGLDYLDWSGHGGHHCQGHLVFGDGRPRVELERTLTLCEAKAMGQTQEILWQRSHSRRTTKFETRADLERAATQWCRTNLTGAWLLKNHSHYGIYRIIASHNVDPARVRFLALIEQQWDRLENWERDNATMDRFYAAWKAWES